MAVIMLIAGTVELIMILQLIKLVMLFENSKATKVTKKKPKEKILYKEDSYPFDEGEPLDWFNLGI